MQYLIQTINGRIRGVEEFNLQRRIDQAGSFAGHSYLLSERGDIDSVSDYIPVGDLDYVLQHLKKYHGINQMHPIEIPLSLRDKSYVGRYYSILPKEQLKDRCFSFVKDVERLKSYAGFMAITTESRKYLTGSIFQISAYTPFISEYRVFVLNGVIEAIQHYKEDVLIFPNVQVIQEIINDYRAIDGSSKAFTVDVGVDENGRTLLIEIHTFVSCGTYGFDDSSLLQMYKLGYQYYVQSNLKLELSNK